MNRGRTVARTRLMYLIHVDWGWIWQRPHALPTALAAIPDFEVLVAYQPSYRRRQLVRNPSSVRRVAIPRLPLGGIRLSRVISDLVASLLLAILVGYWRPRVLVVTHPRLMNFLSFVRPMPLLVYDCMDLATGFHMPYQERSRLAQLETLLIKRCNLVVTSSEYLHRHIADRTAPDTVVTIRNGFEPQRPAGGKHGRARSQRVRLDYFGTVGAWIDFGMMLELLAADAEVEFHLWGPNQVEAPPHERMVVHGPVSHDQLPAAVESATALVMPFVVDDLTLGVDPVKLYEYLSLGLPAVSVYYPELDHFAGLVTFYSSLEDLRAIVERLRANPNSLLPDPGLLQSFLDGSTWARRAEQFAGVLKRQLAQS